MSLVTSMAFSDSKHPSISFVPPLTCHKSNLQLFQTVKAMCVCALGMFVCFKKSRGSGKPCIIDISCPSFFFCLRF